MSDSSCTSMTTSCTSILITILQKYPFDIFENLILPFFISSSSPLSILSSFQPPTTLHLHTSIRRFLHLQNFFHCPFLILEKSLSTTKVPPLYSPSTSIHSPQTPQKKNTLRVLQPAM